MLAPSNVAFDSTQLTEQNMQMIAQHAERYDLALKGSNLGVWDWNLRQDTIFYSPDMKRLLGIRGDQALYPFNDFKSRIHSDDENDALAILDAHLKRSFDYNVEFRIKRDDAEYLWVNARGQAVWDENTQPVRMVGSIQDITQRQQVIEHLTQYNQSLERFAYVCSHDLKEPARIAESFSDLLVEQYEEQLDNRAKEYLGFISSSAKRMQEMIRDILIYSQLGSNSKALQEVDCNVEMKKICKTLALSIEEQNAKIIFNDLPTVRSDHMQMYQVLLNLIGNALKFSDKERAPIIKVRAQDENNHWLFSVEDNGIGMRQKYISKVFGVFQRLHHQDEYQGTGIGLSICQKIMQNHGGRIWVKSELGKGSTFFFTLPKKPKRRTSIHAGNT
jgi:PAS domain S-box-containing protein